ncbi:MAG: DUF192 domain-containing protein [Planctomycetes bacterium]|nr:DUF192 domain-containing protein [Planctomycetota bacterium]
MSAPGTDSRLDSPPHLHAGHGSGPGGRRRTPPRLLLFAALALSTTAVVVAVAGGCDGEPQRPGLTSIRVGSTPLFIEIVGTVASRAKGLMHRRELPEDQGMLFVYPNPRKLRFYMKNTLVPLSIAYLSPDGTIADIHDMRPLDLATVPSDGEAQYALEVNQGWFARHGVKPGDRVELPEAARALRADD